MATAYEVSKNRIERLRRIISLIASSIDGMRIQEVAPLIGLQLSSAKTDFQALTNAGIIKSRMEGVNKRIAIYSVIAEQQVIDNFFAMDVRRRRRAGKPQDRVNRDPNRHFYVAGDDENVKIRVPHIRVFYDPLALPREFFGAGQAVNA